MNINEGDLITIKVDLVTGLLQLNFLFWITSHKRQRFVALVPLPLRLTWNFGGQKDSNCSFESRKKFSSYNINWSGYKLTSNPYLFWQGYPPNEFVIGIFTRFSYEMRSLFFNFVFINIHFPVDFMAFSFPQCLFWSFEYPKSCTYEVNIAATTNNVLLRLYWFCLYFDKKENTTINRPSSGYFWTEFS